MSKVCDKYFSQLVYQSPRVDSNKIECDIFSFIHEAIIEIVTHTVLGGMPDSTLGGETLNQFIPKLAEESAAQCQNIFTLLFGGIFLELNITSLNKSINRIMKLLREWSFQYLGSKIAET